MADRHVKPDKIVVADIDEPLYSSCVPGTDRGITRTITVM
jgi:hypothetical protein